MTTFAGGYSELTLGTGPDDYRSHALRASADLFKLPVQLNLDWFRARAGGEELMRQSGAGFGGDFSSRVSANYRYSKTNDEEFEVAGNEIGLSLKLNEYWRSSLTTYLNLGYGAYDYKPLSLSVNATLESLIPDQSRASITINQDITTRLTIHGSYDRYRYTRDPVATVLRMLLPSQNTSTVAFTLLSFPDTTHSFGLTWAPLPRLNLDTTYSTTDTFLRRQTYTQLGADYQLNDQLNFVATITHTRNTAVLTIGGKTLLDTTRSTYFDLSAGWSF